MTVFKYHFDAASTPGCFDNISDRGGGYLMGAKHGTLEERFWRHVDRSGECWLWTASFGTTGYGQIRHQGKTLKAPRVSWELASGPIPTGLFVCHKCDNPPCVRPDHLFLGTPAVNTKDMVAKGRVAAVLHPERVARGDRHGSHTHPERWKEGWEKRRSHAVRS